MNVCQAHSHILHSIMCKHDLAELFVTWEESVLEEEMCTVDEASRGQRGPLTTQKSLIHANGMWLQY